MDLVVVVGARPNFMKAAPLLRASARMPGVTMALVHTGQHYDAPMSDQFFADLELPEPDEYLGVGSGTHAVQTAAVLTAFDAYLDRSSPDAILVVGDVNSTLGVTLVASKRGVPVAHVEAGLRSYDRTMPEEINRLVTDVLADWLLTPSEDANENLRAEGIPDDRIFLVGNVMIDTLLRYRDKAAARRTAASLGVEDGYGLVTLHRPSNVDEPDVLKGITRALALIADDLPLIFPVHPRTKQCLAQFGLDEALGSRVVMTEPVGYIDSLNLMMNARIVLTDSGGMQEETTALGIPCLTLRENTERPITVSHGTNRVVGTSAESILEAFDACRDGVPPRCPPLWDGRAAERILDVIVTGRCGSR